MGTSSSVAADGAARCPTYPGREFAGLVVGDTGGDPGFGDGTPVLRLAGAGWLLRAVRDVRRRTACPIPAGLRVTDAAAVPVDALTVDQGITDVLAVGSGDHGYLYAGRWGGPGISRCRWPAQGGLSSSRPRARATTSSRTSWVRRWSSTRPRPAGRTKFRKVTDGGPEKVLACSASSLPAAARAARDDAIIATPVKAELAEAEPGPLGNV